MEKFTFDNLQQIVGERISVYRIENDDKLTELTLDKVQRSATHGELFDAFSVSLSGSEEQHCPQGNYRFKHDSFGSKELFLVPHAMTEYQINISRNKPNTTYG